MAVNSLIFASNNSNMKLLFCIAAIMLAISCGRSSSSQFISRHDTVDVVVKSEKAGPFIVRGVYTTVRYLTSEDSSSNKGKWLIDTGWVVRISTDTLRDSLHRPLFDSFHNPRPKWEWQLLSKKYVQRIDLPRK